MTILATFTQPWARLSAKGTFTYDVRTEGKGVEKSPNFVDKQY